MPKLSVIIVTWNVREHVLACLRALARHAGEAPHEIIVVDNASADDTVAAIRSTFPDVTVIANAVNAGFPAANNQGLAAARGEYVLFLNPDTAVGPEVLRSCVATLDADISVGAVGCRLVLEDGRTQYEGARRTYRLRHLAAELLYLHVLLPRSRVFAHHRMGEWDHEGERDVEAISGAFMMARRAAVQQMGGLPAEVFMYHEDLAFCLRLGRAGWRIRYLGGCTTVHHWRASSSRSDARLGLLEGETKLRLIREAEGALAGVAARVLFGVRCLLRLAVGGAGALLLGWTRLPERYPRVFDWRLHGLQLIWTVAPPLVRPLMPSVAALDTAPSLHPARTP